MENNVNDAGLGETTKIMKVTDPKVVFEAELERLKEDLLSLQTQLNRFAEANEAFLDKSPLPIKFFSRVNVGRITELFSELAKALFQHESNLKQALSQKDTSSES